MKVRAAVLFDYEEPVEVVELELRPPGPGEVRVRLAASGVCHSDVHVQNADLPLPVPLVLGHEGAGVVEEVGAGVAGLAPGDHVVLNWVAPCGRCRACREGQPQLCTTAQEATLRGRLTTGEAPFRFEGRPVHSFSMTGTFAEATVVPAAGVVPIPKDVPLEDAALFGCAVLTGTGAVFRAAEVRPGDRVAVIGVGGVGLFAVQAAVIAGAAEVLAVDRHPARLALARELGATGTIDAAAEDPVAAILERTDGEGVDVAVEAVGTTETIRQAFNAARRGGLTVVVGVAPPHLEVSLNAFAFPSQGRRLVGTWYGDSYGPRDIPRLLRLYRRGRLRLSPLKARPRPLEEVALAFGDLVEGRVGRPLLALAPETLRPAPEGAPDATPGR